MRFLHTADLHLGRRLSDLPLLEDQKVLLSQIIDYAVSEDADGVIIAGDVYNKSVPGSDAMMLLDDFMTQLTEKNIAVYMISGNHDSSERISYFSQIIKKAGIYTTESFDGKLQQIHLKDEHGPLTVSMMPFIRPLQIRKFYPQQEIITYEDAVKTVLDNSDLDTSIRNVIICHQFVTGAETSDSEEFAVGGLDCIDASIFDAFDYVALGHLHKPQKVRRESMRYAGSPMKYSLSEAGHRKSVTLVDIGEKGEEPEIRLLPLESPRDVREVKGTMAEVMAMDYSEDYVRVTLTDEMIAPDARVSVATVFPNMIKMAVHNSRTLEEAEITGAESLENKSKMELFIDFYKMQNNDMEPEEEQMRIMEELLKELEEEKYETY